MLFVIFTHVVHATSIVYVWYKDIRLVLTVSTGWCMYAHELYTTVMHYSLQDLLPQQITVVYITNIQQMRVYLSCMCNCLFTKNKKTPHNSILVYVGSYYIIHGV